MVVTSQVNRGWTSRADQCQINDFITFLITIVRDVQRVILRCVAADRSHCERQRLRISGTRIIDASCRVAGLKIVDLHCYVIFERSTVGSPVGSNEQRHDNVVHAANHRFVDGAG